MTAIKKNSTVSGDEYDSLSLTVEFFFVPVVDKEGAMTAFETRQLGLPC
jgi:hypothetical protein